MRLLLTLTFTLCEIEGFDAADGALTRAERLAAGGGELQTLCESSRALLLGRAGRLEEALPHSDAAVTGQHELEPIDRYAVVLNRGMILSQLARFDDAGRDYRSAYELALAHDWPLQAMMALHNLGETAYLRGDLPEALAAMARADQIPVEVSKAVPRLDHGRVLLEAGLVDEATQMLRDALAISEEHEQRLINGQVRIALSHALVLQGEFAAAADECRLAAEDFTASQQPVWNARAQVAQLWAESHGEGHWKTILAVTERLEQDPVTLSDAQLRHEIALLRCRAWTGRGELAEGERALHEAERVVADNGLAPSVSQRMVTYRLEVDLAARAGSTRRAHDLLDVAATELGRAQGLAGGLELRSALALHGVPLAQADLDLAWEQGAEAVLDSMERWRAVTARLPPVTPPSDDRLADLLGQLRQVTAQLRDDEDEDGREHLLQRAAELQRAALAAMREHGRATDGQGEERSRTVDADSLRQTLSGQSATLISFVVHGSRQRALVVTADSLTTHDLGPASDVEALIRTARVDLEMAARHHLGPLKQVVWNSLNARLAALDEHLIAPLGLTGDRLVIVPHRAGSALPWGMLPSLRGLPLTVADSATAWAARTLGPRRAGPITLACVAGPGLRHAEQEVEAVGAAWRSTSARMYGPAAATVAGLRRALTEVDVAHVAAHGVHQQQNPMFASLRLGDGDLFVHDLELGGVGAAHVVLSACDVGRSTVQPGDEALGLAAGLLKLGARSVLASVCPMPDGVASATMSRYHRTLAEGVPADIALASATEEGEPIAHGFLLAGSAWQAEPVG